MKKATYPKYLLKNCCVKTARQFETWHRKRLQVALSATESARQGSAWTPGYKFIQNACDALEHAVKLSQRKNWKHAA